MIKKKDLLVMAYLRQNARIKLTALSKLTSLPVSTIFDRIRMNEGKLIKRHVSLLDFAMLGFSTKANIMLRVAKQDKIGLREFLEKHQNINSLSKINNGFDFLIEGIFRNINELEEFLECMDDKFNIKSKEVHYIIDDIKREEFMSDPNLIDLLIDE
jgi:DNA-binding Lrp family transcriptional regulator